MLSVFCVGRKATSGAPATGLNTAAPAAAFS